ncbi:hypothetical protein [Clostridium sp. 'deep sea']|nr:hypothetical protein [Clostridium sp. 'deep sea']
MYTSPSVLATYPENQYNGSKDVGGDWGLWSKSSPGVPDNPTK